MKCPGCGWEIAKDHLYCEQCGEEIRIVPDFEPEIEREMDETLSALFQDLTDEMTSEDRTEIMEEETGQHTVFIPDPGKNREPGDWFHKKNIRKIAAVLSVLIVVCSVGILLLYQNFSVSYHISKARRAAASEQYVQAVSSLERAHHLDREDGDILFLMAEYADLQGKEEEALLTLEKIIRSEVPYEKELQRKAYEKSIAIYNRQEAYHSIHLLLQSCEDAFIVEQFQQYMAEPPQFNYVGGSYEEALALKLSSQGTGTIYYTLDGSSPDPNSKVYGAPIFLETGTYTVTAYFVNDYGVESRQVSHTYEIDLIRPFAPEVSVYSGEYREPQMIEAEAAEDCRIFYTTDGSKPTTDSQLYTSAIPMPLGNSCYKFVAVSPEGSVSDLTVRTYSLYMDTGITIEMALGQVKQALVEAGILLDHEGTMRGVEDRSVYQFHSVTHIPGEGNYYVIYEYQESPSGARVRTERIYGVSLQDGSPWRIVYDPYGRAGLAKIE